MHETFNLTLPSRAAWGSPAAPIELLVLATMLAYLLPLRPYYFPILMQRRLAAPHSLLLWCPRLIPGAVFRTRCCTSAWNCVAVCKTTCTSLVYTCSTCTRGAADNAATPHSRQVSRRRRRSWQMRRNDAGVHTEGGSWRFDESPTACGAVGCSWRGAWAQRPQHSSLAATASRTSATTSPFPGLCRITAAAAAGRHYRK